MGKLIRVAAKSRTAAVAGAIAGMMREGECIAVQAIGAQALNQAMKGTILARAYLSDDWIDISLIPSFVKVDIDGETRTALRLTLYRCATAGQVDGGE